MLQKECQELLLAYMNKDGYQPQVGEDILAALAGSGATATQLWQELLALEENGAIIRSKRGLYGLPEQMGYACGRLQLTSKGFGFVIPDNKGDKPDIFIPPGALSSAMNNDRVLAKVMPAAPGKKPEGEIVKVITRAYAKVVGVFTKTGDFAFVTPDDRRIGQDIYIERKNFNGAQNGQKVLVEITEWPEQRRKAEGKVVEILGNLGDVGLEILSIIKQNDLPLTFPDEVISASLQVPKTIRKEEINGRRDLRDLLVVTVDGEDAKDLDDAVYVEQIDEDKYKLGVYIADVSYYVTEDSILDREALARGTSVYLVDRVLPMLPTRLSNGICSLNAGEDRLAMACDMIINREGQVLDYEIFPAVINVRYRLSYNIVRNILAGDEELKAQYADAVPMIAKMDELREILHAKRHRRGAVDFDLPEQKVILDEKLHPIEIVQRVHGDAESIIEEFMLAANETVAQHMFKQKWPFIYRVHDIPSEERMQELARLLANFNVKFVAKEETEPMEIQKAVAAMAGRPEERLVTTVALRSMKQAVYQTENIGHFGLAAKYYTHFTSPIRRYPDLIVHRLLHAWLNNPQLKEADAEKLGNKLVEIADHSSIRERAAAEGERATVELKKCEYMADHIGEEFDGTVSGVTSFGMFVELENGVEGLVHISSLVDDYYDYYEEKYALIGTHTRKQYRLGDKVRIEVLQTNIQDVSIDFIMAGETDGVREHIRAQLAQKQKSVGGVSSSRIAVSAETQRKKHSGAKPAKGSKNREPGRRSAKHGKLSKRDIRNGKAGKSPKSSRKNRKKK